jgi:flagellar biosynthesis GTPase FlhF
MDSSLASISLPLPSLSSSWATVSMSEHTDAQSDEQLAQADAVAEDEQEQAPETTQEQLTQAAEAVAENEPEQEQERALETPSEHPINQDAAASDGRQEQQHEEPQRSSYIAEGLANVSLPLPIREPTRAAPAPQPAAPEPAVVEHEVTVGDECTCVFGRGKVLQIRDDGVYVVQARGWNMAHDSRAQFFLQKDALKWAAPKSVYAMSTLEQIEAAADCKTQGGELFVKGDTQSALNHYVKAITYLQHIRDDHSTNSEKAKVRATFHSCL